LNVERGAAAAEAAVAMFYSSVGCWVAPSLGGLLSMLFVMAVMLIYVIVLFEVPCARMYVEFEFE